MSVGYWGYRDSNEVASWATIVHADSSELDPKGKKQVRHVRGSLREAFVAELDSGIVPLL